MEQFEWYETLLNIRERIEESHEDQALELLSLDTTVLPMQKILFFEQNQTIAEVLKEFRYEHDYALVVDKSAAIRGILSREVLQQVGQLAGSNKERMPISTIMRQRLVREPEGTSLYTILSHLTKDDATAVLITDGTGRVQRLLSAGFLARFFMETLEKGSGKVEFVV